MKAVVRKIQGLKGEQEKTRMDKQNM